MKSKAQQRKKQRKHGWLAADPLNMRGSGLPYRDALCFSPDGKWKWIISPLCLLRFDCISTKGIF